ncbi:MAG: polyketide synthase dehydratase domain-containing protein [Deltaproteobacteria bacterium]|nr:polyketide synthase dehydratase domain-containing protein [Deltaproteobacteria bacterium]
MDHQFQGRAVLPAVEAMEILAASTVAHFPGAAVHRIQNAAFDKFLVILKGCHEIEAFNDLEKLENGTMVSKLITRTRSKKAGITRTKEHAVIRFGDVLRTLKPPLMEIPETSGFHVSADTIYSTLVPFGPSYHNLKEDITLFEKGACATVYAPKLEGLPISLGSPFPLDAAFHAACVWGQRYAGLVGFPVGLGSRKVFSKTCAGRTYDVEILPKTVHSDRFGVDIWIKDVDGALKEFVSDVTMKDVSRGRMKPPLSIIA